LTVEEAAFVVLVIALLVGLLVAIRRLPHD